MPSLHALLLSENAEELALMERVFKSNFPKINLILTPSVDAALEHYQQSSAIGLTLLSVEMRNETPEFFFSELSKIAKPHPVIAFGAENILEVRAPSQLFSWCDGSALLATPLDIGEFKEVVQTALDWYKKESESQNTIFVDKKDYIPMKIRSLYNFETLNFPIFEERSENAFLKIKDAGEAISIAFIQRMIQKNTVILWVEKTGIIKYLTEQSKIIIAKFNHKNTISDKTVLLVKATNLLHQILLNMSVIDEAKELTTHIGYQAKLLLSDNLNLVDYTLKFPQVQSDVAEKSVLCILWSLKLASALTWESDMAQKKLVLASLLHDLYLQNEDMSYLSGKEDSRLYRFNQADVDNYLNHMIQAAQLAKAFPGPSETDFLIREGHERPDGKGFPAGLSAGQLQGISVVFIITSHFVNFLFESSISKPQMKKAFLRVNKIYYEGAFKKPLDILKSLVF